ncbi:MAG: hypothetical protein WCO06_05040 [Candidatus Roizmanbacteria bacterium]
MLTVICGENEIEARKYYSDLLEQYAKLGNDVQQISANEIVDLIKTHHGHQGLFGNKLIYTAEKVNRLLGRQKKSTLIDTIGIIDNLEGLDLIIWEGGLSSREIKIKTEHIKEFKLSQTIFQLLDFIAPGQRTSFMQILEQLVKHQEIELIYAMMCKHVRQLICATEDGLDSKIPPWQRGKIISQAKKWDTQKLYGFYDGLIRIDRSNKTSSSIYGVRSSIDILVCYYL